MFKAASTQNKSAESEAKARAQNQPEVPAPQLQGLAGAGMVQQLHRTIGNQALLRISRSLGGRLAIQPKLVVHEPGDAFEREADDVAERVMRMPAAAGADAPVAPRGASGVQRKCACGTCPDCQSEQAGGEDEHVQMKHAAPQSPSLTGAPPVIREALQSPGEPLDAATREFMERRFSRNFRGVRMHVGSVAEQSAGRLGAAAYTVGSHIVFGRSRFAPGTREGRQLIAHELTHVVQQGEAGVAAVQRKPISLETMDPDELLGLKIVTQGQIAAKVDAIIAHPAWQINEGRSAYQANPAAAKISLYHTHFRNDDDRLSYALGYFKQLSSDKWEVWAAMMAYEIDYQSHFADLVVHSPITKEESQKLEELRRRKRAEIAAAEAQAKADRARIEAQQKLEATRASDKRLHKEMQDAECDSPDAGGPYVDQKIALPYEKLVPDPDPREDFDEAAVKETLHQPARFEQLYYDATHGSAKAAWLVCTFESYVTQDARKAAHGADITTFRGLIHALIGTGGYDFGNYGLSPATKSGRRMFTVFSKAFTDEAWDVQLSNQIVGNLLLLWEGGKLAETALADKTITTVTATGGASDIKPPAPPPDVKPPAPPPDVKPPAPAPDVKPPAPPAKPPSTPPPAVDTSVKGTQRVPPGGKGAKGTGQLEADEAAKGTSTIADKKGGSKVKGSAKTTGTKTSGGAKGGAPKVRVADEDLARIKQLRDWDKKGKLTGDVGGLESGLRSGDPATLKTAQKEFDEVAEKIKKGEKPHIEDFEEGATAGAPEDELISTAGKVELEDSVWLRGRIKDPVKRKKFMDWLKRRHKEAEKGEEIGSGGEETEGHGHYDPDSPAGQAELEQVIREWEAEQSKKK